MENDEDDEAFTKRSAKNDLLKAAEGPRRSVLLPGDIQVTGLGEAILFDKKPTTDPAFVISAFMEPLEMTEYFFTTYVNRQGGVKKLFSYAVQRLVVWGGIITMFCKGTLFTMDKTLVSRWIGCLVISVLTFAVFTFFLTPPSDAASLEGLTTLVNSVVPFCLALYVSLMMSRWWNFRENALGGVFQAIGDMAILVGCALPGSKWLNLRNHVAKYSLASIDLLVKAARKNDDLDSLRMKGLLTKAEVQVLRSAQPFQRAMAVWAWIMRIVQRACEEDEVPGPVQALIHSKVCQARDSVQIIHTYLWTQLPFGYVHLVTWLVSVQNVCVTVKAGVVMSIAFCKPTPDLEACVFELVSGSLMCMLYQGMLVLTYVIHDPFGDDIMDFPVMAYTGYVAASIDAIFQAVDNCPGFRAAWPEKHSETMAVPSVAASPAIPLAAAPAAPKVASSAIQSVFDEHAMFLLNEISDLKKHDGDLLSKLLESKEQVQRELMSTGDAGKKHRRE